MYLLFDIGGTKMRISASRDGKSFEEPKIISTPEDFSEGMKMLEESAWELAKGEKIKLAAGGIAGPLDREHTMSVNPPHLPGWKNKPLQEEIAKRLGTRVLLENDTALVGLGEAVQGAGKGYGIAVYMTVSTGVGGARFVDGKIDRSALGFEPGHQIIDQGKTLEQLVSGSGVRERYKKDAREIADKAVWDELAKTLAVGLNNTVVHWSPDAVVLGGAMIAGDPSIPFDALERYYKATVKIFPVPPPLKKATLGDFGGLYGALELAKHHVQAHS